MPAMTPANLKAVLDAEKKDALAAQSASKLSAEREKAQEYYLGEMPDLDVDPGRSSAVSMDVADTIEGLMPSLMEIFCGGDEVVRFEPVGPEDVPAAEQETDYVNHVFMQQNPGFLVLYSFVKDALLSKVGIVKVAWEEEEREETETYYDQPETVLGLIKNDPEMEIVAHTPKPDGMHDFTIARRKNYGCAKVMPVPPEEFGISRRARSIKDTTYCFHEVIRTEADLVDDGYDEAQVSTLTTYTSLSTSEAQARDTVAEGAEGEADSGLNKASRPIRITEHYIRMDYEGSGKSKLYRAVTGGEQGIVLQRDGEDDVTEEDFIPFAAMTPVIITHRFFGRSIADLVMDIQKIKTALLRSLLDNAYLANNPRVEVPEAACGETTLDDLLVSRPGGIVRTKGQGGMLNVIKHPDIGAHVYPLMEYQDTQREWRTGVTRQGQGLDANALQNTTATASNNLFNAAQARMKMIARIFAETGIKDLFELLHGTIRKHGKQAQTVRLKNEWVEVDPRNWKTRNDMTANVGLGSGGKAERVTQVMALFNVQKEMVLGGKTNLVRDINLFNTAKELVKLMDLKTVEPYFTDPESDEGKQAAQEQSQRPDPETMKLHAESQLKTQEMQQNAQLKQLEMQQKAEIEKLQAQADIATNQQKFAAELQMMREKHQLEMAALQAEMARDDQKHQQSMAQNEAKIQVMREGHFQKTEFAAQTHEQGMAERKAAAKEPAE
jgi:hypothetical protein